MLPSIIYSFVDKRTSSVRNQVFLPTDERHVWLLAKMWYNNAESAYHQAVVHFGK